MEQKRVILVAHRERGKTPSSFEVTLATPLYLTRGRWYCNVESICASYNNTSLSAKDIPSPIFIECDFVETTCVNDTMYRILGFFSLQPSRDKGYKNADVLFPFSRSVLVSKDYISRVKIRLLDQRFQSIPEEFFKGDIVIEVLFRKYG